MVGRRAGQGSDADLVEVDLHDVDVVDEWSTAAPQDRQSRPGHARRRRALFAAAVAACVGFVVGANVVEARQDAARLAALADVPGVLAPLAGPVSEQWRATGSWVMAEADGVLVVGDGPAGFRGIDARSGEERWSLDISDGGAADQPYCHSVGGPLSADPAPAAEPVLVCVEGRHVFLGGTGPATGTVSLVDPATGTVQLAADVDGAVLTTEVVDGDLVVATVGDDGHVEAVRHDDISGEVVWRYRSPEAVAGSFGALVSSTSVAGAVLTVGGSDTVAVDLLTGDDGVPVPVQQGVGTGQAESAAVPGGATVEWSLAPSGGFEGGQLLEPDGTVRFELAGTPWLPPVHDGSVPEVLVVQPPGAPDLQGIDGATGEPLWEWQGGAVGYPAFQVGGVLAVGASDDVTATDVRDGTVLWSVQVDPAFGGQALTDGVVVLLHRVEDGASFLAAHGLRDGVERWRTTLPDEAVGLMPTPSGGLVALTGRSVIGLG